MNGLYGEWAARFSLCPALTVDTDNLDYVQHDAHLDQIAQRIQDRLHGKESLTFEAEEAGQEGA